MSMGWPMATDFIFIETVDVLKNNFGSLAKLELTVSAEDCINVLFGCTNFTKMFVKGMDPNVLKANWEKVMKEDFPKLDPGCAWIGPNGCSNITKLIVKSVKLQNLKWPLVKSSIHFKKLKKIVLYLDDVSDMDEINVTKIFRIDKNLILDLLSSTRVMLVLKQAGSTWFELCRDPVNFGLIQVIEKSPPRNQLL